MITTINYGDKRDYPVINIYQNGKYMTSTTWAKTCREAVSIYILQGAYIEPDSKITANYKGGTL